jgi:hypothetical protein
MANAHETTRIGRNYTLTHSFSMAKSRSILPWQDDWIVDTSIGIAVKFFPIQHILFLHTFLCPNKFILGHVLQKDK